MCKLYCIIFYLWTLYFLNECTIRKYYIGIKEETWNYAPSGKNLVNGEIVSKDMHAAIFLAQGPHRIGSVYKKAVYRQYTDEKYTEEIVKPDWLGFIGPILRAEVDDVIVVHLKNFASRPYSLHPHGVFYEKDSEGALYPDETWGRLKQDDAVPPAGNHTYTWIVKPEFAPTETDANCLTWVYHSHGDAPRDIASGLIGALLTCRKGILGHRLWDPSQPERVDVERDFFLMFSVVDENLSWYLEDNIRTFCSDPENVDRNDEDFQESNQMHAINGYLYANLPGLEMCLNRKVAWHLFGMGNEVDIHSAHFHGHTVLNLGHRVDVLNLFPATFVTVEMVPRTTGQWMLSCQVNDHIDAGMQAFYNVTSCGGEHKQQAPPSGKERRYYVAAEEVLWDYAPLLIDTFLNQSLTTPGSHSEIFFGTNNGRLGGRYQKAHYVEYTDETFTSVKSRTRAESHLGIMGPVIRGEVGDIIEVTLMNKASWPCSVQAHGLQYEKQYEGTSYGNNMGQRGTHVSPGEVFTYRWQVSEGPTARDPACISYVYYSGADPVRDTSSGLMGPLLVCKRGSLDESGYQRRIDKEFFLLFSVLDENLSWYIENNEKRFGSQETDLESEDFQESNKMHAVNGYMYGNLPGLDMCDGDRISWHALGLGTEVDIHGVYFQGNTFQREGMTRDTFSLFPHTSVTVLMQPRNEGTFEISCRTSDHYLGGMRHHYTVKKCTAHEEQASGTSPSVARYFIAAEEVEWDYSPSRVWELEKHHATDDNSPGSLYVQNGTNRIGSKYKKVVYREYTDATFRTRKERHPEEEHLEILGPIIRAEVGEQIVVNFKNKASHPFSMHAHGVKMQSAHLTPVRPGEMKRYQWQVPESSGPGISDPNCISFAYYSATDFVKDVVSGLIGPLIICRRGTLDEHRRRRDVDREFALLFMVFDENESWYLEDNLKTYLDKDLSAFDMDEEFQESNKKHAINGKLYGNLRGLVMREGDKTDWYLLGMGNEVDMHTVHFHAQSFTYKTDTTHRADVYDLFPGTFQTVELFAGNPGTWLLHCHVADHIHGGMETTFTILSRRGRGGNPTLNDASSLKGTLLPTHQGDLVSAAALWVLLITGLLVSEIHL